MFITLEGTEGSGKSTVAKTLVEYFLKQGQPTVLTREPGGVRIAEKVRGILLDSEHTEMDPRTEALLFAAARRQHFVEKIKPALAKGAWVICDRFLDSSLAYQGYARSLGVAEVLEINRFAIENTMPDLTLFLKTDPEVGLARIAANANREVNRLDTEKLSFHQKVLEGFEHLGKTFPARIKTIDANRPLNQVVDDALMTIAVHTLMHFR